MDLSDFDLYTIEVPEEKCLVASQLVGRVGLRRGGFDAQRFHPLENVLDVLDHEGKMDAADVAVGSQEMPALGGVVFDEFEIALSDAGHARVVIRLLDPNDLPHSVAADVDRLLVDFDRGDLSIEGDRVRDAVDCQANVVQLGEQRRCHG